MELKQDSGYKFSDEFFELKEIGKDQSVEASLLPANRGKNRYTNILSYDKTRGKLDSEKIRKLNRLVLSKIKCNR